MSNTSIQLKKSGVTGNTPSSLAYGEVAINYADGRLYYKNSGGGTSYISNQFSFDTINANNSLILAGSVSDTLSLVAGENVNISTNTSTKTITISSVPGSSGIYANGAFDKANAAFAYANALSGGTSSDGIARDWANSAGSYANSAFIAANSAYGAQNTTGTYANSAFYIANLAYNQANTATNNAAGASLYANGAFIQANSAFANSNVAYTHAEAAFAKANTGTTALDVNSEIIAFTIAFS
jgi:hypothetical protein